MEFPDLGKQCCYQFCKQLDFLPAKCDACKESFCKNHVQYDHHGCVASVSKNVKVPTCPLCQKAVPPSKRGENPNWSVAQHIQNDCKSVGQRKAYTNKCSMKRCKISELIPVVCQHCSLNFCLKHRHQQDHNCAQVAGSGLSNQLQRCRISAAETVSEKSLQTVSA